MPNPNFVQIFEPLERRLRASLEYSRALFAHSGARGDGVENAVREFFADHLPRRFDVGHGEVIDRAGHRSAQTDLVISNEDQPLIFPSSEPNIFLIEGVAAAGEVKSRLTTSELGDMVRKGRRYRSLRVTGQAPEFLATTPERLEWFYYSPPFIGIALENDVSHQTIVDRLDRTEFVAPAADQRGEAMPPLDALFILGQGAAIYYGPGTAVKYRHPITNSPLEGWFWHNLESSTLVFMLAWMHKSMPRVYRFESILTPYLMPTPSDVLSLRPSPRDP